MQDDFLKYQAQTTPHPLGMEISHAKGSYIYDTKGKAYLDFVAGVSASSLGHAHPKVVNAIKTQLDKYLHVMVYGEYIQRPAVDLAKLLAKYLPQPLETTYLVNSGTEAIEGALKLARRYTGRSEISAAKNAYHGNTLGSLSLMDYEERKHPFLQKVQKRCNEVGAVFILDEIQPGIGRTGKLFGFQNYNCQPDIVVTGKGLGGGLPIGAFTASKEMMACLSHNPKLGHITTFGGNPVIAAAALATLKEVIKSNLMAEALEKEQLIRKHLHHKHIKEIRGRGLMLALITNNADITNEIILRCQDQGLILFWLLFERTAIRITPPLTISNEEIIKACTIITSVLDSI